MEVLITAVILIGIFILYSILMITTSSTHKALKEENMKFVEWEKRNKDVLIISDEEQNKADPKIIFYTNLKNYLISGRHKYKEKLIAEFFANKPYHDNVPSKSSLGGPYFYKVLPNPPRLPELTGGWMGDFDLIREIIEKRKIRPPWLYRKYNSPENFERVIKRVYDLTILEKMENQARREHEEREEQARREREEQARQEQARRDQQEREKKRREEQARRERQEREQEQRQHNNSAGYSKISEAMILLNLKTGFTKCELQTVYRQQVRLYHPDNFSNKSEADQRFANENMARLNAAYELLKPIAK